MTDKSQTTAKQASERLLKTMFDAARAARDPLTTGPKRCLTCWWWGLRDSASIPEANRQCHRFPPIATRNADGEIESEWPWTNQRDYCGEYRETESNG